MSQTFTVEMTVKICPHTDLNFTVTGPDGEIDPLFGPGQRADIVLLALHLHEQSDVSLRGVPQVNTVMKSHSQDVTAAPVEQI